MIRGLIFVFVFVLSLFLFIALFIVIKILSLFKIRKRKDNDYYRNTDEDYVVIEDGEDEFLSELSNHISHRKGENIIPDSEGEYVDFEEITNDKND